jgi:RNA polymerase sigma-70 factor (ECF subfamily)
MTGNSRSVDRIEGDAGESARERGLDTAAVRRCLAGDRDAFGELVARWQDRIYAVIHRMTGDADLARDLAQETFLRAWSSLSSFEGGAAFGTWLHAIALNQVRSEMRKRSAQKRGAPVSFEALAVSAGDSGEEGRFEPAGPEASPAAGMEERDRARVLREAIARLDPEFREVLVLREFRDLPYEEIAEITGAPVGTVRSRLFRARSELRRLLEGRV